MGWVKGRKLLAEAREEKKMETQIERLKARLEEVGESKNERGGLR